MRCATDWLAVPGITRRGGLLRPVAAVAEAGHVEGVVGARLAAPAVLDRRDSFTDHWHDDGQVRWLDSAHIDLVRGPGRLSGPRSVSVGSGQLQARHAVAICTGSSAVIPPIPGLAEARPWTSREATSSKAVPGRLAIIGGGVVGCEMAAAWEALGAQVTLLVRGGQLLPRMEAFAGDLVAEGLGAGGVDVRRNVGVAAAERSGADGPVPCGSMTSHGWRPTRFSWLPAGPPHQRPGAWRRRPQRRLVA